jgi:hypothetical protein
MCRNFRSQGRFVEKLKDGHWAGNVKGAALPQRFLCVLKIIDLQGHRDVQKMKTMGTSMSHFHERTA